MAGGDPDTTPGGPAPPGKASTPRTAPDPAGRPDGRLSPEGAPPPGILPLRLLADRGGFLKRPLVFAPATAELEPGVAERYLLPDPPLREGDLVELVELVGPTGQPSAAEVEPSGLPSGRTTTAEVVSAACSAGEQGRTDRPGGGGKSPGHGTAAMTPRGK